MSYKIKLNDAFKGYTLDQDKICTPSDTVRHFKDKLKEVNLDILEKTVRIDNGRLDIPVYFSICSKNAEDIIGTKKQMGKGGRPDQAEASAVMELAERFSFFSFCKNADNFFTDEYQNLKDRALPFEAIAKSISIPVILCKTFALLYIFFFRSRCNPKKLRVGSTPIKRFSSTER